MLVASCVEADVALGLASLACGASVGALRDGFPHARLGASLLGRTFHFAEKLKWGWCTTKRWARG